MILMVIQGSGSAAHSAARAAPGTALGIQALRTARFQMPWGRRKMWFNIYRDLIFAHSFSSRHSLVTAWQSGQDGCRAKLAPTSHCRLLQNPGQWPGLSEPTMAALVLSPLQETKFCPYFQLHPPVHHLVWDDNCCLSEHLLCLQVLTKLYGNPIWLSCIQGPTLKRNLKVDPWIQE